MSLLSIMETHPIAVEIFQYQTDRQNIARATPLAWLTTLLWQHMLTSAFIFISLTDTHYCTDEMYKMNKRGNAGMLMNAEVSGGQGEGEERGRGTIHTHGSS